jgi:hypothetical protein
MIYDVWFVVNVRLESVQSGAYEDDTILRCVGAAFPSTLEDALKPNLPAGIECKEVVVQMSLEK